MKSGLLWFDNDPKRPLAAKIDEAARRYAEKFGRAPNTCFVNPAALEKEVVQLEQLRVIGAHNILPNHFWLGVMDRQA